MQTILHPLTPNGLDYIYPSRVGLVNTTQNSKKRCKISQFSIDGNLDFHTLNMIAYNRCIVDQVTYFPSKIGCRGKCCEGRKSCCYSDPIALKYGRFDVNN